MTTWPVLDGLPPDDAQAILRSGRRRHFARGETLFHHGDPADTLHLIDRGHVAVRVRTPQGNEAILSVLGPGVAFGELALIGQDDHRTATVTALDACETVAIHASTFERMRASYPSVDRFLLASLSAQVERLSAHLLEALYVPSKLRVLRHLVALGDTFEGAIPLTQEDIAAMSGTTRPTVNEALREFERGGSIRIGRGRIEILDRARLAARLSRLSGP